MVGGLVDQQKGILLQKHGRQQHFRPLPVGEDREGLLQGLFRQVQEPQLPLDLPVLRLRGDLPHHLQPCPGQVRHLVGKVLERHGGGDGAAVGILPLQQPQEGGLPPAVPPGESQLPAGVDLKAHMVKDQLRAALISKRQIRDVDHRHIAFLLCVNAAGAGRCRRNGGFMGRSRCAMPFASQKNGRRRADLSCGRANAVRPVSGAVGRLGASAVCLPCDGMEMPATSPPQRPSVLPKHERSDPHLHTPPFIS